MIARENFETLLPRTVKCGSWHHIPCRTIDGRPIIVHCTFIGIHGDFAVSLFEIEGGNNAVFTSIFRHAGNPYSQARTDAERSDMADHGIDIAAYDEEAIRQIHMKGGRFVFDEIKEK